MKTEPAEEPATHLSLVSANSDTETSARVTIPPSDWARMWATLPAKHIPQRLAYEIQLSITEIAVWVMTALSAMGFVCTVTVIGTLLQLKTSAGIAWAVVHLLDYGLIALVIVHLHRLRRQGTLTAARFNRSALPVVIVCSTCWGLLPWVVGTDPIANFYLASCVSAMLCFFGFFWTAGHWPLSVLYSAIVASLVSLTYIINGRPESSLVTALLVAMYVVLLASSVVASVALVNARYETVLARERKQMVQLLMQDYERGGHDWIWEADERLKLAHVPPRMALAADGDQRFRLGAPLLELIADNPDAVAAVKNAEPFQANIVTNEGVRRIEVRLWGRPNMVSGRCLGYRGVGSDEGAARRAAQADRTRERLDAMIALTNGLAHDFNNLLATILGSVELATATSRNLEPDVAGHLQRAADACLRTRRITADLAAASGHDLTSEPAPFDARDVVHDVLLDVRPLCPEVTIHEKTPAQPAWTLADRSQCTRAMRNLVDNACQAIYGAKGTCAGSNVWIEVGTDRDEDGMAMTSLAVRDDGPGVPDEVRHRLFEPFFTTRKNDGGSGLGLAVASGFARQAGGELELERTKTGASFRLLLPQATRADIEAHQSACASTELEEPLYELGGCFLVVEDDQHLADTLSMWIKSFGATVDVARSVGEAIDYMRGDEVDLACVISDLVLPDGDGFSVIATLRDEFPSVPAIYVSGFTQTLPADVDARLRCPFVAKPFSSNELLRALRRAGIVFDDQPADTGTARPEGHADTGTMITVGDTSRTVTSGNIGSNVAPGDGSDTVVSLG